MANRMHQIDTSYRAILRMAAPISMGAFVQFLVVLTDNFFLSRVGQAEINGAGNAGLLYLTFSMVAMATTSTGQILIARRIGENDRAAGYRLVRSGVIVMLCLAVVLIYGLQITTDWLSNNVLQHAATCSSFRPCSKMQPNATNC